MKKSLVAEFVLLAALWGSSFLFMRLASVEFGPWVTAGLRVMIATLVLIPLLWLSGRWHAFTQKAWHILFIGLLNAGIPFALYSYAVLSISTGLTAILNATIPFFGALIAWFWLNEKPSRRNTFGLLVGFVGVVVLSWDKVQSNSAQPASAIAACLGATFCYGIAASYTKKYLKGTPPLAASAGSLLGASLGLLPTTVYAWPKTTPSSLAWLAALAAGVVCTAFAYVLYYRLIEKAGLSRVLSVSYLIPVFALVYGAFLLKENITVSMVAGGMIILAGVALATSRSGATGPKHAN